MKQRYDRSRVMRDAHKQWRAVCAKTGWDFARCLKLAWAVEKRRAAGPEYYQPREAVRFKSGRHDYLFVASCYA